MDEASEDWSSTARARKRRMQRRSKKHPGDGTFMKKIRLEEDVSSDSEVSHASSDDPKPSTTLSKDALAKIPGVKKQARYVPTINMSKEELTLWRKEARRLRNRESAAASRQKTQQRITELEEEVGTITKRYQAALRRIVELEAAASTGSSNLWMPAKTKALHEQTEANSPVLGATHTVSPPLSPRNSFSLYEAEETVVPERNAALYLHPTTFKISRHNACVKINPNRVVVAI